MSLQYWQQSPSDYLPTYPRNLNWNPLSEVNSNPYDAVVNWNKIRNCCSPSRGSGKGSLTPQIFFMYANSHSKVPRFLSNSKLVARWVHPKGFSNRSSNRTQTRGRRANWSTTSYGNLQVCHYQEYSRGICLARKDAVHFHRDTSFPIHTFVDTWIHDIHTSGVFHGCFWLDNGWKYIGEDDGYEGGD